MTKKFKTFIIKQNLFEEGDQILLAVSGGMDSVVMCELFHLAKYKFAIAHCNFQLRGEESDGDEKFVKGLSVKYKVPFFSKKFDTTEYAESKGISTQMAARELRYEWFEETAGRWQIAMCNGNLQTIGIKPPTVYISVATHLDDEIETFLINITRGTGISGLHGIKPKKGKIIRPLLYATRHEIMEFAIEKKLLWREDSSNSSDKYIRNKIRHSVVPVLREINPDLTNTFSENINRIRDAEEIFHQRINEQRKEIFISQNNSNGILISIKKLQELFPLKTYLFEFLKPYGFSETVVKEIISSLQNQPGKKFFSQSHCLIKDRKFLIINIRDDNSTGNDSNEIFVKENTKEIFLPIHIKFNIEDKNEFIIEKDEKIACLDYDKLQFPLVLRYWKDGDSFVPFGMKGRKKISDFLTDKKIPLSEKKKIFVLTSLGKIVWVVGQRIDARFKVREETKKIWVLHTDSHG